MIAARLLHWHTMRNCPIVCRSRSQHVYIYILWRSAPRCRCHLKNVMHYSCACVRLNEMAVSRSNRTRVIVQRLEYSKNVFENAARKSIFSEFFSAILTRFSTDRTHPSMTLLCRKPPTRNSIRFSRRQKKIMPWHVNVMLNNLTIKIELGISISCPQCTVHRRLL